MYRSSCRILHHKNNCAFIPYTSDYCIHWKVVSFSLHMTVDFNSSVHLREINLKHETVCMSCRHKNFDLILYSAHNNTINLCGSKIISSILIAATSQTQNTYIHQYNHVVTKIKGYTLAVHRRMRFLREIA